MEAHRVLTLSYDTLALKERAQALLLAREAGRQAAAYAERWDELESPATEQYQRHVVESARSTVGSGAADGWLKRCNNGQALADPRVQAFFFGWHERATEIMAE